jgi:pimeloyl-ACP methyl ester carboxylesterase
MRFCNRSEVGAVLFGICVTVLVGDILGLSLPNANAQELARPPEAPGPVADVGPARIVITSSGTKERAFLPLYSNASWDTPQPEATRAVLIIHGAKRNAVDYFASGQRALAAAGSGAEHTVLLVPQFLIEQDVQARGLGVDVMRWKEADWTGGLPATGPIHLSSFAVVDAILSHLADPKAYPKLKEVVIAGHSGGAQFVQRYAVVGNGVGALEARKVAVRYVVANPSSYLYFSSDRPVSNTEACPSLDRWKYGLEGDVPPYVTMAPDALERRYAQRDVIYLLGTADVDPRHPALDTSCAGEAQGPFRYARGTYYFRMLQAREGANLKHRLLEVDGVAHDGDRMFTSTCGLAALFNRPGCAAH